MALADSEARFRNIVNASPMGMHLYELRADGRLLFVSANPAADRILGVDHAGFAGKTIEEAFPGLVGTEVPTRYRAAAGQGTTWQTEQINYDQGVIRGAFEVVAFQTAPDRMAALFNEITDRKRAEARLKQSLAEKETLLRELYHRTKNNMQVIRAMLSLRAARAADPGINAIVRETDRRIQAMSMVHQMLYRSQDLSMIDLRQYVQDLTTLLLRSYRLSTERISLDLEAEETRASIDLAIPCGLILNELMSNALRHAFPGDRQGTIRIRLARVAPEVIGMVFSDDGVGAPPKFDPRTQDTLGFRTIIALTEEQLRGKAQFESAGGVTWRLRFRESPDPVGGQI